jgi:hypothetical protein
MTTRLHIILIFVVMLLTAGCASMQTIQCAQHEQLSVNDLIYFGATKPDGIVTKEQWAEFLKKSVTPRFPQGLTVWQASGQWRDASGKIMQEGSFILNIVHPDDKSSDEAVRSIIREYKAQFNQDAVLRTRSPVCASF